MHQVSDVVAEAAPGNPASFLTRYLSREAS